MAEQGSPEVGAESDETLGNEQVTETQQEAEARYRFSFDENEYTEDQVREWRESGLRQSDYTRKTQELADERRELDSAQRLLDSLRTNPMETMEYLAEQTGWNPLETQAELDALDPVEKLERQVQELRKEQHDQQVAHQVSLEVANLHRSHGEFDEDALYEHAMKYEIGNLTVALEHMQAQAEKATRTAERAKAEEAKRKAPPVAGGTSATATSSGAPREGHPKRVRDALAETLQELGLSEMPAPSFDR